MNPMETNKTFKVWLNPLRFALQNIDAQLHKARRVQLMELEIKPFTKLEGFTSGCSGNLNPSLKNSLYTTTSSS
jgi:hypothetical protein